MINLLIIAAACETIAGNFNRLTRQSENIARAVEAAIASLRSGGKIMFCGNGGSTADSQHLAAELLGCYGRDRALLPALALTVDNWR